METDRGGGRKKVRVLIVEDSAVAREHLAHILSADDGIEIAGFVPDGNEALAAVESLHPDVVTMDIHMPRLDGFSATRQIMERAPVPIIIVTSSANATDVRKAFSVIDAGAVGILEKPPGKSHPDFSLHASRLVQTVKLMSEVRVVRRWARNRVTSVAPPEPVFRPPSTRCELIAMGASTGGPPVLQTVLCGIKSELNVPVLIVQHIAAGFIGGLVEWLGQSCGLPVEIARHGMPILPRHVYFAPDDAHLVVKTRGRVSLRRDHPEAGLRPSAAALFRSVAEVYGPAAVGVLLTGMGKDGAAELKSMYDRQAVTFAQDAESCAVFGMPAEAIRLGGVTYALPPARIAAGIASILKSQAASPATPSPASPPPP